MPVTPTNPFAGWVLPGNSAPTSTSIFGSSNPNFSTVGTSTFTYPTNPTFPTQQPVSTGGGSSNTQGYFNTVASLVSQWLTAYGRNPTTQLSPSGQITGIANPNLLAAYNAQTQQTQALAPYQNQNLNNSPGGALGSGLDGIITWATNNPIYVFLGIAGVYLLMREPPRRR